MDFIRGQWTPLPYPSTPFTDQTVIVTGANVGLGLEAARHFTRLGAAKVILACRSLSKGEAAAASIAQSTGRNGTCEVWQVDIGNLNSVKEFCARAEGLDRLDVLCENAGVAKLEYSTVDGGIETTVAVNVVGTFLMALNLLPVLRRSAEKTGLRPRLVIVTSGVHAWSHLAERSEDSIFDALNQNNAEYMAGRYPTSKLLQVFAVRALAERMRSGPHAGQSVILNMVNPGLCHSSLAREAIGIIWLRLWIMKLLVARTTEMGSRTLVAAAAAGMESDGKYMSDCVVKEPSEFVRSEEGKKTQERVFEELMEVLEKAQPGISKNI